MNILLVAATHSEIEPAITYFNSSNNNRNVTITTLLSGVGMVATAYSLGRLFAEKQFDLAINAGIAGAFDRSLKPGETVLVKVDCFAELGAEDGENFISIDALGFGKAGVKPELLFEHQSISSLKKVFGITVNKVHGNDETIYHTSMRLNPQIESMEGAAFFYACNQTKISCLQLRAISNYVERRNRDSWNITLAVQNLNQTLIHLIESL